MGLSCHLKEGRYLSFSLTLWNILEVGRMWTQGLARICTWVPQFVILLAFFCFGSYNLEVCLIHWESVPVHTHLTYYLGLLTPSFPTPSIPLLKSIPPPPNSKCSMRELLNSHWPLGGCFTLWRRSETSSLASTSFITLVTKFFFFVNSFYWMYTKQSLLGIPRLKNTEKRKKRKKRAHGGLTAGVWVAGLGSAGGHWVGFRRTLVITFELSPGFSALPWPFFFVVAVVEPRTWVRRFWNVITGVLGPAWCLPAELSLVTLTLVANLLCALFFFSR